MVNLTAVWLLTGLWHGAAWTFVLWGAWFLLLLAGEKLLWGRGLARLPRVFRHGYTLLAVTASWVLFRSPSAAYAGTIEQDKELQAIFERTYGAVKRRDFLPPKPPRRPVSPETAEARPVRPQPNRPEYLLVDGYNIIFAWEELKAIARESLDAARKALCDLLCNFQGYQKCRVIAVFDAYKVRGGQGSVEKYHNIHVVYTKEAETADAYIERATYELGRHYRVKVATSDGPEQLIILGHGALRVSASAFREEMEQVQGRIAQVLAGNNRHGHGALRAAMEKAEKKQREE